MATVSCGLFVRRRMSGTRLRVWVCWAAAVGAMALGGCIERKLTIRSEPTGASVTLDGRYIGVTPVTVHFDEYGGREVILSKAEYYRHREIIHVRAPVYQWLGPDFFFEVILPVTVTDEQAFSFRLKPVSEADPDKGIDTAPLEKRAEELQKRAESYGTPKP